MHTRKITVLLAYFLTVLLSLTIAKEYSTSGKRVSGNMGAFKPMMRYGRTKADKVISVYPRGDSFFMATRYGKRSSWSPMMEYGSVNPNIPPNIAYPESTDISEAPKNGGTDDLSCAYTGVLNLYRCTLSCPTKCNSFSCSQSEVSCNRKRRSRIEDITSSN